MKTQKLQFALTSLHNLQKRKNQKLIKKPKKQKKPCPIVIMKANRKILTQISKSTKFFTYYIVFINNSNDSRYTSCLFKKKKENKKRNKKKKAEKG